MFSNLASYIFGTTVEGGAESVSEEVERVPDKVDEVDKLDDNEWEMIGEGSPALTLGSLNDMIPRPSLGSTGSSAPSLDSEDSGEAPMPTQDDQAVLTRTARRSTVPFGSLTGRTSLSEVRSVRAAQSHKAKESGKHFTSKALDRRNKAVKHHHAGNSVKKSKAPTMALKTSGSSRHLKQC